jgi:hypothetical protein
MTDRITDRLTMSLGALRAPALAVWAMSSLACGSSSSNPGAEPIDGAAKGPPSPVDAALVPDASTTSDLDAESALDANAATDSATPDGGSGGGDGGPCDGPGIVLCDDFEQAAIDTGTWTKMLHTPDPHSTLTLDTTRAKTGKQSLHATISSNAGQAMISETRTFPMPMNKVYGRAYLYFGSPVITDHTSFVVVQGTMPFNAGYRFGAQNAKWLLNFVSDHSSEMSLGGDTPIPTGSWLCLQWAFDGVAGSFQESIDGVALDAKGADAVKYAVPTFNSFRVGMETYGGGAADPGYDLWVDDVAIGTAPIDCLP